MFSVDSNLASVRKHCARWDTGPDPGSFQSGQIAAEMVPGANEDCAVEAVFLFANTQANVIMLNDNAGSSNIVQVRAQGGSVKGVLYAAGGGPIAKGIPGTLGYWYHVLVHWQDSGAGTARIEVFINGVSIGATVYIAKNAWTRGAGSFVQFGETVNVALGRRLALARLWIGTPPAASLLYNLGYIDSGVYAELVCQWDMRPGYGNTAFDTTGLFDIPWVGVDQPDAIYSGYRYTGQCRDDRWTPP